ncbi:hypothetical protein N8540_04385 [Gammaproteobacteria bacterium]|nr:hypothetical protein [Gammaproteobacteria bacterium]MDC1422812.1 hypothetical protein [Gammaproteobacteria bacterium]
MAFITAETRSSIVELAMGMLNQAPSTAMLETLIAKSVEGASTQDLADYIATTAAFTAEYPATQTAREFATEMFGKLITGGTLDADINTAVIDLLEGLLTGGTTKAQGFVAVIDFLANPANAAHADLGDIAQSFQNRADAAEYFSITKELGGSTTAELAAAIASVTSDAATLTAANTAADATATAEAAVAGQTFTLTTGLNSFTGAAGDDTFNGIATGLSAGDTLDGGDGTDTLAITDNVGGMNISVPSVTVTNIENATISTTGSVGVAAVSSVTGVEAVPQIRTITPTIVDAAGISSLSVGYGTGTWTSAALDGTVTAAEVNALVVTALNTLAGETVAAAVEGVVVVTAPTAGTALPTITVADGDADGEVTFVQADARANVAAVTAVTGSAAAAYDLSSIASLTDIDVSAAGSINLKASATANVDATSSAGAVTVTGGLTQDVVAKGGFTVSGGKGAISVTDSAQGAVASSVKNGTSVVINSTSKATGATTGTITVGTATTDAPTGGVTITSAIVEAKGATDTAGGAITAWGSGDISITQSATKAVQTTDAAVNGTITNAPVTVVGVASSSVVVDSSAAVAAVTTVKAVAAEAETTTATFGALTVGETIIVNGLTFTAGAAGATAAQAAAAFSNLTAGATNGPSTKGTYTGAFSTEGWTSSAVGGTAAAPTVTFTGSTAAARTDLADTGVAVAGISGFTVTNQGVTAVKAVGNTGVVANTVSVTDASSAAGLAGVITDVTAHNYTTLGVTSNALTNLNVLGGSGNITIANTLTGNTATTLNLSVDGVSGGTLDDADVYTTLNVATKYTGTSTTATGSTLADVTSTSVDDLNVSGDKVLTLTSTAGMTGLINVAVTGTAGLTATFVEGTMKTIDTSGTTGKATITFDATDATYTGGAGVDAVTTSATAPTKAISLGAGDDSLTLASGTTAVTGAITGGEGTDTLSMVAADIVTADNDLAFAALVTGFEALTVTGGTGAQAINLTNMGITSNITVATGDGTLTVNNIANGGTLTLTGDRAGDGVTLVNALFGAAAATTDVINVAMGAIAGFDGGTVTAANVETINLTALDLYTTASAHTLALVADKATAVNITGNAGVNLTLTGSTKIATLDASASTGAVSVESVSTAAITMTGGSAADSLTANGTTASTLIGGAGADTLTTNTGLTTLTGGDGNDLFVIGAASANGGIYTTISDATAGDRIQLIDKGTEVWNTTAVALASTASFSDYLNAASAGDGSTNAQISWFAFGGNTYIVEDSSVGTAFVAGTDAVVALTGVVDLSAASLNGAAAPILMIG